MIVAIILVTIIIPEQSILPVLMDFQITDLVRLEPLHVDFDVGNESITEHLQEKQKKTMTLYKVYTPPVWNTFKEAEAI